MGKDILPLDVLLAVPYVDTDEGFDISPDGKTLAFSWNANGHWEIYLLQLDIATATPRQLTHGSGAKFAPHWSPDGQKLAYVLDEEGGECFDIYIYDMATKQHTNITPGTPETIHPGISWSPDGQWLAFASNRSGRFECYKIPAQGGQVEKVLDVGYPPLKCFWSPNGRWLACVVEAKGQDYYTYIMPVEGGDPFPVSEEGVQISARDVSWSPEGERLAFNSDHYGRFDVGIFDLPTHQVTWLTDSDGDREAPAWSADGRRLVYVSGRGPVTVLEIQELEHASTIKYRMIRGVHHRPKFTPNGKRLIFSFNNPRNPDDLWMLNLANGSFRQLTRSMPRWLLPDVLVMPVEVTYPSLDGSSVPALLYRPASEALPHLAVINIHGGPNWLSQITWDPFVQHMVSRGWVVLAPNYRGSTGYGREWQLANQFDLGGGDTQDIVAGADYLVREGFARQGYIAVTGRSYGGYLTMTCLTQNADYWAGGSAAVPFLNWFTASEAERQDLSHWDQENFGNPETNRDLFYERSPFFYLDKVTAPVQLVCGAHDPRCPASESIQARDRLVELGKEVDLVLYEDEGHVFLKTPNVIDSKKRQINFLARVLEASHEQCE